MKAILTPRYGSPSVLTIGHLPDLLPGPGEVLVAVHASPVTAGDRRLRAADFPGISAVFGRLLIGLRAPREPVQGTMFAGRVAAVGAQVTRFAVGDDVFGAVDHGAWAEQLVIRADGAIAHRPAQVSAAQAAAAPYGAGTAIHFLRDLARVRPGERVLILGGSGGVGRFAVQVARHLGAHVTAVGSKASFPLMRSLGANEVLDYRTQDFTQTGEHYDVIFDIADASCFRHSRPALTPTGRYLTLFISLRVFAQMAWTRMFGRQKALFSVATTDRAIAETIRDWLAEGVITPVIAAAVPLDRAVEAHERAEADAHGDVVIQVRPAVSALAAGRVGSAG
ncbi:MAG: NAD(P)-dependent alcohol dehydrogenase [Myxococcota bacterium]